MLSMHMCALGGSTGQGHEGWRAEAGWWESDNLGLVSERLE